MTIEALFNKQATIQRKTVSYSDSGSPTTTWQTVATDVSCAIETQRGDLTQGDGGRKENARYNAFFPASTDIQCEDRVVIGSETFLVEHVSDAAGRGNHLEAILAK